MIGFIFTLLQSKAAFLNGCCLRRLHRLNLIDCLHIAISVPILVNSNFESTTLGRL